MNLGLRDRKAHLRPITHRALTYRPPEPWCSRLPRARSCRRGRRIDADSDLSENIGQTVRPRGRGTARRRRRRHGP